MRYLLYIILLFNNIYISNIDGFPISVFVNLLIVVYLLIFRKSSTNNIRSSKIISFLMIIFTYSILNGTLSQSIYYPYVIVMNIIFIITITLYLNSYYNHSILLLTLAVFIINNIITAGLIVQSSAVIEFAGKFNDIFNITSRTTYRINGITGGTLKAGIISYYIFFLSVYFVQNKPLKYLLASTSVAFSFFQARTAMLFMGITIIFYLAYSLRTFKKQIKPKNFLSLILLISLIFSVARSSTKYLKTNYSFFEGTIAWQKEALDNGLDTGSVSSLNKTVERELNRALNKSSFLGLFVGNGQTNWKGEDSVKSDNGFVVQFIGFGVLGSIIIWFGYLMLFGILRNRYRSINKQFIFIYLNLFFCHLLLNYKSTSLIGFNYLHPFIISLWVIHFELNKSNKHGV